MKNDCSIVRDLLPLYVEDMVSDETAQFVSEHLNACTDCKKEFEAMKDGSYLALPNETEEAEKAKAKSFKKVMKRINKQFNSLAYVLVILAIFLGAAWTGTGDMFYNILLMPAAGVFGYFVFSNKAFYKIPLLVAVTNLIVFGVKLLEDMDLYSTVMFTVIYTALALTGVVIAWLISFAFKKEK